MSEYVWKLNFDSYRKRFDKIRATYSQASDEQLQSIIYTQGKCNLYSIKKASNKYQEEKQTEINDAVYTECTLDNIINEKKISKYLQCCKHCELIDFIPKISDKKCIPNIKYLQYIMQPHYLILVADCDILIHPKNMQYITCKNTKKDNDILHYADKIKITKNMIKEILDNKTYKYATPNELCEILPKVMVHYDTNKYERILRVTRQMFIGYSIVCCMNL